MPSLRPISLILALGMSTAVFAQEKNRLDYSFIGSISPSKKPSFLHVMGVIEAQRQLLKLAAGPLNHAAVEASLQGTSVPMLDLIYDWDFQGE